MSSLEAMIQNMLTSLITGAHKKMSVSVTGSNWNFNRFNKRQIFYRLTRKKKRAMYEENCSKNIGVDWGGKNNVNSDIFIRSLQK